MDNIEGNNFSETFQQERRNGERRLYQRRSDTPVSGEYSGEERRQLNDRRVTIINRLKTDVADRRAVY